MASNLSKAFAALRKRGLFARQNYLCCQGCGWAAIDAALSGTMRKGRCPTVGAVFYHAQDAGSLRNEQDFYLSFGRVSEAGLSTENVGRLVVQVLAEYGVKTEWDGNPSTRILVMADSVRTES